MLELVGRLIGGAVLGLIEAVIFRGSTPMRRAYEAYVRAWREVGKAPGDGNVNVLRNQFKVHSAPGAYVDPDGNLTPWLEAWDGRMKPRDALRLARQASSR